MGDTSLNGRQRYQVAEHTGNYTLTAADNGTIHTNKGAGGAITCSLPAATKGLWFIFSVEAAQEHRLDPSGNETISLPSTGVPGAAGKYLTANAIGEGVMLFCTDTGSWRAGFFTGTWTAEA
jgi:hypothetical protein